MSIIDRRRDQMFPVLDGAQMGTAMRFASGPAKTFRPGEVVFEAGARHVPTWLVLEGGIEVVLRDGLGREKPIVVERAGQFSGDVSQLSDRGVLATGRAGPEGCTAMPVDAPHLRALIVGAAELGEIVVRALILRRVGLLEEEGAGAVLVGRPGTPDFLRLQEFLARNGYPNTVVDASERAAEGRVLVERLGVLADDLPLIICPSGTVLKRPTNAEAGASLGITPELES